MLIETRQVFGEQLSGLQTLFIEVHCQLTNAFQHVEKRVPEDSQLAQMIELNVERKVINILF